MINPLVSARENTKTSRIQPSRIWQLSLGQGYRSVGELFDPVAKVLFVSCPPSRVDSHLGSVCDEKGIAGKSMYQLSSTIDTYKYEPAVLLHTSGYDLSPQR